MDTGVTALEVYMASVRAKLAAGEMSVPPPPEDPSQSRKRKERPGEDIDPSLAHAEEVPPLNDAFGDTTPVTQAFTGFEPKDTGKDEGGDDIEMGEDKQPSPPLSPVLSPPRSSTGGFPGPQEGESPKRCFFELDDAQRNRRINRGMKHLCSPTDMEVLQSVGAQQVDHVRTAWLELSVRLEGLSRSYMSLLAYNEGRDDLLREAKQHMKVIDKAKVAAEKRAKKASDDLAKLTEAKNKVDEELKTQSETIAQRDQSIKIFEEEKTKAQAEVEKLKKQLQQLQQRSTEAAAKEWLSTPSGRQYKASVGASATSAVTDDIKSSFEKAMDEVAPDFKSSIMAKYEAMEAEKMEKIRQEILREMKKESAATVEAALKVGEVSTAGVEKSSREKSVQEVCPTRSVSRSRSVSEKSTTDGPRRRWRKGRGEGDPPSHTSSGQGSVAKPKKSAPTEASGDKEDSASSHGEEPKN